jgi:hypothetical protein
MSTSYNASKPPSKNAEPPAESTMAPIAKPADSPLDPRTRRWIHHLAEGMKEMALNEAERRRIAKKLF